MVQTYTEHELEENGLTYIVRTYSGGAVVKYMKPSEMIQESEERQDDTPTQEEMLTEVLLNTEYMTCLLETNMGMV